jgi:hypothetical protein
MTLAATQRRLNSSTPHATNANIMLLSRAVVITTISTDAAMAFQASSAKKIAVNAM